MKLKLNLWNVLVGAWVISLTTAIGSLGPYGAIKLGAWLKPAETIYANIGIAATESLLLCTGACHLLRRHDRWQNLRRVKQQFLDAPDSEKYDRFIELVNLADFEFDGSTRMNREQRDRAMRHLIRRGILKIFAPEGQQFVAWSIAEENRYRSEQFEREWNARQPQNFPEPVPMPPLGRVVLLPTGRSCDSCKFFHGTDGIHCAVHPSGPGSDDCRDWERVVETYTWGFFQVKYADRCIYYLYRHDEDDGEFISVFNELLDRGVTALSPDDKQLFVRYFGVKYPSSLPKKTFRSERWEGREAIEQVRSMSSLS